MEMRRIGGLDVSVVGLGCNNFGWRIDEAETLRVVDEALDSGVNFFDTADVYGGTKSEEFLGRVLKGRRDRVVLATKFGLAVDDNRKGARPEYVKQACEDSLRRLATNYIDLYQLHKPDETVPISDTLGALDDLVRAGKVREIGCSNFSAEQLQDAQKVAGSGAKSVSVQNEFSILHRDPETNGVLEECRRQQIAFLPYFPLANGLLTGKYRRNRDTPEGTRIRELDRFKGLLSEENLDRVERLAEIVAESKNESGQTRTLLELAFGWLLSHEVVASVIAGATSPEQIRSNAAAATWKLTPEEMTKVAAAVK